MKVYHVHANSGDVGEEVVATDVQKYCESIAALLDQYPIGSKVTLTFSIAEINIPTGGVNAGQVG